MREPSPYDGPGVVAILDQLPELKIVQDAIGDGTIEEHTETPQELQDYGAHLGFRFIAETKESELKASPNGGPYLMPETWKTDAEFKVLESDVDFVTAAAYKTLQKRRVRDFLKNALTGRDMAASRMFSFFVATQVNKTPSSTNL